MKRNPYCLLPRAQTLALSLLLACASPLAHAELSVSIGLNPYGYVPYPGSVSVYPPGPGYYPPPVIYLGNDRWGHDDEDGRHPGAWQPPRPHPGAGPIHGHAQPGGGDPRDGGRRH